MIFELLFSLLFGLLTALLSWLPGWGEVPLKLPYGIDDLLQTAVAYYRGAVATLPYLEVVFQCFLYAMLFEIGLLVLKIFLGSRTPSHE